eukprot:6837340-Prymnesium_polylepis.1
MNVLERTTRTTSRWCTGLWCRVQCCGVPRAMTGRCRARGCGEVVRVWARAGACSSRAGRRRAGLRGGHGGRRTFL